MIYNSQPFSLLNLQDSIVHLKPASLRLNFTLENKEETKNILSLFVENMKHGRPVEDLSDFTRGHFKRGVE